MITEANKLSELRYKIKYGIWRCMCYSSALREDFTLLRNVSSHGQALHTRARFVIYSKTTAFIPFALMDSLATNHKFQAIVAALGIALSLGTYKVRSASCFPSRPRKVQISGTLLAGAPQLLGSQKTSG